MRKSSKFKLRLTVDVTDHAVLRVSVKERARKGKYVPVEHPWGVKVLAALKMADKATSLVSRGVADLQEVRRTANASRRRKQIKKPPIEGAGVLKTNRTARHNGRDHEAWA